MSEKWRDVMGYKELYQVSSLGRVKSFYYDKVHGRILKPRWQSSGYLQVGLWRDGKRTDVVVHRLVAERFLGPAPSPKHEVNHKNGDKTDNRVENLEWVTSSQNKKHASEVLGNGLGSANGSAILTDRKVRQIRKLYDTGDHIQAELGERFGVATSTICRIVNRKRWKHVA